MPLPTNGTPWPPAQLATITPRLDEWAAWYSGDPKALRHAYQRDIAHANNRPSQYQGGVVGAVARFWWGRPNTDLTAQRDQLHVPIAADLCQASADLLFSEPPKLTVADTKAQARLDELADDGLFTALAESAEVAAALGGVYLRTTWDRALANAPFTTAVHADAAWPEFRWGRLVAVTFWRKVAEDGQRVFRHLERHELDSQDVGIVLHGLYEGTVDNLGRAIPLTEVPSVAGLATQVDADGVISTESPGLAVTYVRNQGPQRRWRSHPLGAHLGRSDLDGVEGAMDSLDETYSSWMRDVRLGKARILVARSLLEDQGPGQGAVFDSDREVFSPLNALATREGSGLPIEKVQFEIRVDAHAATAQELTEVILRGAGYSAQTFGEGTDGSAMTATEVHSKAHRSFMTRDRKIRQWRPGLGDHVEKLLAVDAAIFNSGIQAQRPTVAFSDAVQADPEASARTVEILDRARAISTRLKVAMAHPDWDDTQIDTEVALIQGETVVADPAAPPPFGA